MMETVIHSRRRSGTGAALACAFAKEEYAMGLLASCLIKRTGRQHKVPDLGDVTERRSVGAAIGQIRSAFETITALASLREMDRSSRWGDFPGFGIVERAQD